MVTTSLQKTTLFASPPRPDANQQRLPSAVPILAFLGPSGLDDTAAHERNLSSNYYTNFTELSNFPLFLASRFDRRRFSCRGLPALPGRDPRLAHY
jgi:hypothetical protein